MTKIGKIKAAVVQRVGNKSNEDGVAFSDDLCQMDGVEEPFLKLINGSFKFDDWKQFYFKHWYFALEIVVIDDVPTAIVCDAHYEGDHHNDILLSEPYDEEDSL